ncbi:ABC transporter substrate-binding protein [Sporolactobacillus sp. Y61]|uniref:ABC transporter substrate-binding protein n=1 Tax=Sporolactobacillus sp. Y61 TaxID=3160863 RepID=A0AAU8IIR0_9BACL
MNKLKVLVAGSLAMVLLIAGCGSSATEESDGKAGSNPSHYPVTVHNYTKAEGSAEWHGKDQVFQKEPKRIMATTRTVAELLLHLGLKNRIVGVGGDFGTPDKSVSSDYESLKKLSHFYVGKEAAIGTNPDIIVSRGGLFENADWGVGTIDSLNNMGIGTYVLESSIPGGSFDSIYTDIRNLGKIFNVQDRAQAFSDQLKERQKKITSKLSKIPRTQSFAYLHMSDLNNIYVYPAYGETFFNKAFQMVKLNNIFAHKRGDISVETLVQSDPDVLIVLEWHHNRDEIRKALYNNPKLSSMKAIKNRQVYTMDYNYLFSYSYNTLDGLEQLAKDMYPDLYH